MTTEPLDLRALLSAATGPPEGPATALRVGHLHLHVAALGDAVGFYRDGLGFAEMAHYPGAAFLAAGGYHHHVAVNVWRGEGVPAVPEGVVGLRCWTIRVPAAAVAAARERLEAAGARVDEADGAVAVHDPSGNLAHLVAG